MKNTTYPSAANSITEVLEKEGIEFSTTYIPNSVPWPNKDRDRNAAKERIGDFSLYRGDKIGLARRVSKDSKQHMSATFDKAEIHKGALFDRLDVRYKDEAGADCGISIILSRGEDIKMIEIKLRNAAEFLAKQD